MEATERIFDFEPYTDRFEAAVLSCEAGEGGFWVVLDKTAFFPEGGGQFSDLGKIGGARVIDVREDKGGVIRHLTDGALEPGEKVSCEIDWERRFDFMQQHSGEHIFSGLAHSNFGANNVGFHLGLELTTVDLDVPLSEKDIDFLEAKANEAVYKNLPIEVSYPSPEELKKIPYRSKKELSGRVRIVSVPGYDICACCGTHVQKTGEIGIIKITSFQNYKGGVRLTMLCGGRALSDYRRKNRDVTAVTTRLSVKPEELSFAVGRLEGEITERKIYESALRRELFSLKAERLGSGERVCVFESGLSPDEIRRYCLTLGEKFAVAAVFSGKDGEWKYAVSSKTKNCADFAKAINAAFSGRGGGKPELVQGSCGGKREEIELFFNSL